MSLLYSTNLTNDLIFAKTHSKERNKRSLLLMEWEI